MPFYSASGLREIALWLDELIDIRKQLTQQAIADCANSSGSTIGSLRMHRHNQDDVIVSRKPDPDLVLSLGRCIPDPQTEEIFTDEWRLLWVAIGREPLRSKAKLEAVVVRDTGGAECPYSAAVSEIRRGMGDRSIEEFAKAAGISKRRLNEILTSTDPILGKALPRWEELLKLSSALYPDKSVEPLIRLYGYGSKVNGYSSL